MIFVNQDLNPRNRTEALIVSTAVQASWVHDRALRVQTARLNRNIADAERREAETVFELGKRLYFNRIGPSETWGIGKFDSTMERISYSGVPVHPDDPDTLVRQLQSTPGGCRWMLAQFAELRALLLPGKAWEALDKFKAIRLLGRQPLDIWDRDVCEIHLRTWTIRGMRDNAWSELRSELRKDEYGFIQNTAVRRWPELHDSLDKQKERQALIALIDRAVEQVKAKLAVAEERAERDAALRADCLSFDDSHEGELIRRYETSSRRAFLRSLSEFYKARREADQQEEPYPDDTTEETAALDPIEPTATIATTCEPEMECDDDLGTAVLPSEPTDVEPAGMSGESAHPIPASCRARPLTWIVAFYRAKPLTWIVAFYRAKPWTWIVAFYRAKPLTWIVAFYRAKPARQRSNNRKPKTSMANPTGGSRPRWGWSCRRFCWSWSCVSRSPRLQPALWLVWRLIRIRKSGIAVRHNS